MRDFAIAIIPGGEGAGTAGVLPFGVRGEAVNVAAFNIVERFAQALAFVPAGCCRSTSKSPWFAPLPPDVGPPGALPLPVEFPSTFLRVLGVFLVQ